jgi:RNA polymerase sigma factor (sigma-70 family)
MAIDRMQCLLEHLRSVITPLGEDGALDGELLERFFTSRDEAAFELLVWRHHRLVLGVCSRILRGADDVEDAFQATFLVLARKGKSIRKRGSLSSWLFGVARRVALEAGRVSQRRQPSQSASPAPVPEPGDELMRRELQGIFDVELGQLPEKYRAPVVLCYLEGLTYEQAGRQLGCSKGTISTRLTRARELLRARLAGKGLAVSTGSLSAWLCANAASAGVPNSLVIPTTKAATAMTAGNGIANVVSVKAAALAEGVVKAMMIGKLKSLAAVALVLGLIVGGASVFSGRLASAQVGPPPAAEKPVNAPQSPARKPDSAYALEKIGAAMLSYFDIHKVYPGPALFSKDGKPLLSWRVALLPYLGEGDLYRQFRLDEPWDSAHNQKLLAKMPAVYCRPGGKDEPATPYQVFVGKGTMFEGPTGCGYSDIPDGTSNTIAVVEAAALAPWTKPEDLAYSATGKIPELGGEAADIAYALFADGKVHALKRRFDSEALRVAITRDDGIPTPFDKLLAATPKPIEEDAPAKEREKEGFTAWGRELDGWEAGLGVRPGAKLTYRHGETVTVVLLVRNLRKEDREFKHIWAFFVENPPTITNADGQIVSLPGRAALGLQQPRETKVAPGKEVELYAWQFNFRGKGERGGDNSTIHGTDKFRLQCERIVGPTSANPNHPNPALDKLATGKLELEVKADPQPALRESDNTSGRPVADDPPNPQLKPLLEEVRKFVEKRYPKATVTLRGQTIHFEFNTRQFMIHDPDLLGEWQDAHEETGPRKGGIHGDIELRAGEYMGMAAVPQTFDKRYFTLLMTALYSRKLDQHLFVLLKYPRDVPKDFVKELEQLLTGFEKHVPAR